MKWLRDNQDFPAVSTANAEGIVAVGGDFSWQRLLRAYTLGIFPWSNPDDPIIWWSPNPRFVLFPKNLKIARSMRPYINQRKFKITYDTCFGDVIRACQKSRRQGEDVGTWISEDLLQGYTTLHEQGYAHSVEVWQDEHLVGGLYGVAIGKIFCGESMFARANNASKYAFINLVTNLEQRGYWMIDCQMPTDHLKSLGGSSIPREEFVHTLSQNKLDSTDRGPWTDIMMDFEALQRR